MSNELESDRTATPIRRRVEELGSSQADMVSDYSCSDSDNNTLTPEDLYAELSPSLRWYLERNHSQLVEELRAESVEVIEIDIPSNSTYAAVKVDTQIEELIGTTETARDLVSELQQIENSPEHRTIKPEGEGSLDLERACGEPPQQQIYPEGSLAIQIGEGHIDFVQLDQYLEQAMLTSTEQLWVIDLREASKITPMLLGVLFAYSVKIQKNGKRMALLLEDSGILSENLKNLIFRKFDVL